MTVDVQEENSPLQIVVNELDELAEQWATLNQANGEWKCKRVRPRRKFRTPCDIWFFESDGRTVRQATARTRNLSERGVGLLTDCPIPEGSPIEVRIQPSDYPPTYLGGVMVFCRNTQLAVYEVGVSLRAHQDCSIFAANPCKAVARFTWLQQGLRNVRLAAAAAKTPPCPAVRTPTP